jgi:hypothetical protein
MSVDLAPDIPLIGIDELILGEDVELDSGVIMLAKGARCGNEHLLISQQHLMGALKCLLQQAFSAEQIKKFLEHLFHLSKKIPAKGIA